MITSFLDTGITLIDGSDAEATVHYNYYPGERPGYRGFNNVIEPGTPPEVEIVSITHDEIGEVDPEDVADLDDLETRLIERHR